ncbi:MAG: hypothetical protein OEZ01_04520 [Candidatus Heimdallarchaeota archaeon]|nr:hypothetical protein [Candidatus Heimdallarchaeota archaeon]MDH5645244.1 hypothetical protein [Candidatus Heimdallarchaeota archaeon]
MIGLGTVDTFVDLTINAKEEIKRQLELSKDREAGVRIQVILDRYSGFIFDLEFDKIRENDYKVLIDGIPVITDKSYLEYVRGMKIDFDGSIPAFSLINEKPTYNCVPGSKYECPSCNLYEEQIID